MDKTNLVVIVLPPIKYVINILICILVSNSLVLIFKIISLIKCKYDSSSDS